jgi:hypothetical protein
MADVILENNRRYDLLLAFKDTLNSDNLDKRKDHLESYFERFWKLQDDEFKNWQEGMVGDEVYKEWMLTRWRERDLKPGKDIDTTYYESWQNCKGNTSTPRFSSFMDQVFTDGPEKAMGNCRPRWFRRLGRKLLS